jgi:hypothetical protein
MGFVPPVAHHREGTTVARVRRDETRRGAMLGRRPPAPPDHDAALEATMYPTICSFHASGGVIAEGLAR